jgi:sporulation protein YlmC with PRC-barrel domain
VRLVHDLLDMQILDARRRPTGKVDDILLELRAGRPPRVSAIEIGGLTLARRLHPWLGSLAARWAQRAGPAAPHAVRIPWAAVRRIERSRIHLRIQATATPLWSLEGWLAKLYTHIPGSGR